MFETCRSTVLRETNTAAAISGLVDPALTIAAIPLAVGERRHLALTIAAGTAPPGAYAQRAQRPFGELLLSPRPQSLCVGPRGAHHLDRPAAVAASEQCSEVESCPQRVEIQILMLGVGDDCFDSIYRIRFEPVDDHEHGAGPPETERTVGVRRRRVAGIEQGTGTRDIAAARQCFGATGRRLSTATLTSTRLGVGE